MENQEHINTSTDTPIKKRFQLRKWYIALIVLGFLLLFGCCFFLIRPNFYAGPITIEQVTLNNEFDPTSNTTDSKNTFHNRETIYCSVWTSGVDAIIGTRWYYEDELVLEFFEQTQDNRITTSLQSPLKIGSYRVDVSLSDGKPLHSLTFNVAEAQSNVVPPQPTPSSHVDLENDKLLISVPFAFDETWSIDETDWEINEVKIVFLQDSVVIAVVVVADSDATTLTENQARTISKPIALYAWQNGYIETAKSLQIDGKKQQFRNMFITLFNPQTGKSTRIPYEFGELESLSKP